MSQPKPRPSRVLVTGANGFVGRALVDELHRRGAWVTAAVRREAALPTDVRVARAGNVGPTTDWREALADCRLVVHLAARVHVMRDLAADSLASYREVNVGGTLALAQQAAASGVQRFVFLSTIKVNGECTQLGRPFSEADPPGPVDPYGRSKMEAEQTLLALAASTGMEVVVIRPPLVYGAGVRANFLSMARWLRLGVPLPLGSLRNNRRSLMGLDNLIDLTLLCLEHQSAANQVSLAADGEDLSTTDLLRRTAAAMDITARLLPVPLALLEAGAALLGKRDVVRRLSGSLQVDIEKARSVLGWRPPVGVDEGLRRAVQALGTRTT